MDNNPPSTPVHLIRHGDPTSPPNIYDERATALASRAMPLFFLIPSHLQSLNDAIAQAVDSQAVDSDDDLTDDERSLDTFNELMAAHEETTPFNTPVLEANNHDNSLNLLMSTNFVGSDGSSFSFNEDDNSDADSDCHTPSHRFTNSKS